MIPKIIHYCWFGGNPKTPKMEKCIESWKKYCPDYEIMEWNEQNFPIDQQCRFVQEAYKTGKYAFVSDVARLKIVFENGGIYLDTDVELLKPLDDLLNYKCYLGWQDKKYVANGLGFGAEKGNPIIKENYDCYIDIPFIMENGEENTVACPVYTTDILKQHGLKMENTFQNHTNFAVFPVEYFNPLDDATNRLNVTSNTYSIHWYAKTWVSKRNRIQNKITRVFHRCFGVNCFAPLKKVIAILKGTKKNDHT